MSGSTWTPLCPTDGGAPATVVQAPPSSDTTVLADSLSGSATLAFLQYQSKPPSDVVAGESIYAYLRAARRPSSPSIK